MAEFCTKNCFSYHQQTFNLRNVIVVPELAIRAELSILGNKPSGERSRYNFMHLEKSISFKPSDDESVDRGTDNPTAAIKIPKTI
jgi:hypothetical protein